MLLVTLTNYMTTCGEKVLPLVHNIRHHLERIDGPFYKAFYNSYKTFNFPPLFALIKYLFVLFIDYGITYHLEFLKLLRMEKIGVWAKGNWCASAAFY